MKKIIYQGGLTKLITSKLGERNKFLFSNLIKQKLHLIRMRLPSTAVGMDVVSFSSANDINEQVLSILSFLRHVGTPHSWTIYSDGTHTTQNIQLLEINFEFVKVKLEDWESPGKLANSLKKVLLPYKQSLIDYATNGPLGKKTFYFLNHVVVRPTLFIDSDIMFYSKASVFKLILNEKVNGWFLADPDWGCLDSRYLNRNVEQPYQANGGLMLFNHEPPNIKEGLDFLVSLESKFEYFTDQTIFHIITKSNDFLPLDPRIFIVDSEDQFDFSYKLAREKMAIRHYTGPVRHKMWQRDWQWQLSFN